MTYPTFSGQISLINASSAFNVYVPGTSASTHTQIVVIGYYNKAETINTPSGWTALTNQSGTLHGSRLYLFKRVGVYSAGNVAFTSSGDISGQGVGLSVTGPLDAYTTATSDSWSQDDKTSPTVTSIASDSVIIHGIHTADWPRTIRAPSGLTTLVETNHPNNAATYPYTHGFLMGAGAATKQQAVAGASGASNFWPIYDTNTQAIPPTLKEGVRALTWSLAVSNAGSAVTIAGGGEMPSTYVVTSLSADPSSITGAYGGSETLTVTDQNGVPVVGAVVSSSNTVVATVTTPTDSLGRSTVSKLAGGTSTLTVSYSDAGSSPANDTTSVSLTFAEPVWVTAETLPNATDGAAYSQTVVANGTSVSYAIITGNPGWLSIGSSTGTLTGTAEAGPPIGLVVRATEAGAGFADRTFYIYIDPPAGTAPVITTTTLAGAIQGNAYTASLVATGTGPFTWSLSSGSLPAGLALVSGGLITGIPTGTGSSNFTVRATDAAGLYDEQALTLSVTAAGAVPSITTTTLAAGTVDVAYSQTLVATGNAPITWAIIGGSLPIGLTLNTGTGAITGTPTAAQSTGVEVRAANVYGYDDAQFTVIINGATVTGTTGGWSRFLRK